MSTQDLELNTSSRKKKKKSKSKGKSSRSSSRVSSRASSLRGSMLKPDLEASEVIVSNKAKKESSAGFNRDDLFKPVKVDTVKTQLAKKANADDLV